MPRTKNFDPQVVLSKAIDLFWLRGYHATSIQDLVDHLGINRASLYDTYGGKWNLFEQSLERYMDNEVNVIKATLNKDADVIDSLRAYLQFSMQEDDTENPHRGSFIVNSTTELLPELSMVKELIQLHRRKIIEQLNHRILKAIDNGQLAKDVDSMAIANSMYTYSNGLNVVKKVSTSYDEFQDMIDVFLEVLV